MRTQPVQLRYRYVGMEDRARRSAEGGGERSRQDVVDVLDAHAHAQQPGVDVGVAGVLWRRSMVVSTPPRLVAGTTRRTPAQTASAAAAPPRQTNETIAPVPG